MPNRFSKGKKNNPPSRSARSAMLSSDLSFDDIRSRVQAAIEDAEGIDPEDSNSKYIWVRDIFPSYVVYCLGYDTEEMYKRTYLIQADGSVTLGDALQVRRQTSYETVQTASMSITSLFSEEDGDFLVYKNAKLFEAGSYPDKNLEVDPDDLKAMVSNFSGPRYGDVEHVNARATPGREGNLKALRGLTQIRAMYIDPQDPWTLRGDVAVHKFIDPRLEAKGVSLEIPIESPTTVPFFTLTSRPRVAGAALMSEIEDLFAHPQKEQDEMDEEQKKALAALQAALAKNPNLLTQIATFSAETTTPAATTTHAPAAASQVDINALLAPMLAPIHKQASEARESSANALFDRLIGSQVGKKFTPAQRDELHDKFVAARILFSMDDAQPNNAPKVALFDSEQKKHVPVVSRVALFDSLMADLVGSMGETLIQPGEVFGSDYHVVRSSTPVQFSAPDGQESEEELNKWAQAIYDDEMIIHGYDPTNGQRITR